MAKKKKKQNGAPSRPAWHEALHEETKHSLWAIFSIVIGVILSLAYFGKAGAVGGFVQKTLWALFGKAFFLISLVCFVAGIAFLKATAQRVVGSTLIGGAIFLIGSLGLFDVVFGSYEAGYVGFIIAYPLLKFFDFWASVVILSALLLAALLIMLNFSLRLGQCNNEDEEETDTYRPVENVKVAQPVTETKAKIGNERPASKDTANEGEDEDADIEDIGKPRSSFAGKRSAHAKPMQAAMAISYVLPPLDFLEDNKGTPSSGDIKANANIIKRTLANFGIDVEMAEVRSEERRVGE